MRRILWVVVGSLLVGCSSTSGTPTPQQQARLDSGADAVDAGAGGSTEAGGAGGSGVGGTTGAGGAGSGGSAGGGASGMGGGGSGGINGTGGAPGVGGGSMGGAGSGGLNGTGGVAGAGGSGMGGTAGTGDAGTGGSSMGGQGGTDGGVDLPDGNVPDGSNTDVLSGADADGGNTDTISPPRWFPRQPTNNSAELLGDPIGEDCGSTPTLVRKAVPLSFSGTDLEAGTAYLLNDGPSDFTIVAIPITNTGTDLRCFTGANTLNWLPMSGSSLLQSVPSVLGSVAVPTGGTQYSSACLESGETALVFAADMLSGDLYKSTASVALTLGASVSATPPGGSAVPTSYAVTSNGSVVVSFQNMGALPARILTQGGGTYLVMDKQGLPLMVEPLVKNPTPNGNLGPGLSGSLSDNLASLNFGCGMDIRPFINFGVPQ